MNKYIMQLKKELSEYKHNCNADNDVSALELLWYCYFQSNIVNIEPIRKAELNLRPAFEALI